MDYAKARYYSNQTGRFTSPDPMLSSGLIESPQTWNRYSYVSNNPLNYIDPLGLYRWSASLGGDLTDEQLQTQITDIANGPDTEEEKDRQISAIYAMLNGRETLRNALTELENAANNQALSQTQRDNILRARNAYGEEGKDVGVNKVILGIGAVRDGAGAQTEVSTLIYGQNGRLTGYITEVTIGTHTTGQDLIMAVGHEGSHVADNQAAYNVWVTTGDRNQARNSVSNITKSAGENRAYRVSAAIAQHQNRDNLSFTHNRRNFEIWRRGMTNVDQTVLNGLLQSYDSGRGQLGTRIIP